MKRLVNRCLTPREPHLSAEIASGLSPRECLSLLRHSLFLEKGMWFWNDSIQYCQWHCTRLMDHLSALRWPVASGCQVQAHWLSDRLAARKAYGPHLRMGTIRVLSVLRPVHEPHHDSTYPSRPTLKAPWNEQLVRSRPRYTSVNQIGA